MARPTKYKPNIAEKIFSLFRADTYTVKEVCRMVKISCSTFYSWRTNYSEFSEGLNQAFAARNDIVITEAKRSLLKRIRGYMIEEKHITTIGSGTFDANRKEIPVVKEYKIVEKYVKPDTAAIIFTLCNGEPENWKNRQNIELTGKDGKDFPPARVLTKAELKELYKDLADDELDTFIELKQKAMPFIK